MKFIRAILRHSLPLAIVIGASVAYYYRDDWLPKFYEQVAELRAVSEEYLPGKKAADEAPAPEKAVVSAAADEPAATEPVAVAADVAEDSSEAREAAAEPGAEPAPPVAQAPVAAPPPATDLSRYRPLVEEGEVDGEPASEPVPDSESTALAPAPGDTAELPVASETTADSQAEKLGTTADVVTESQQPEASTETTPAPSDDNTVSSSGEAQEQLRTAARSAFWRHDYEQAERDYKALAELDPADPNAYGELGNVYFSQGKWDLAADAFYEAGVRLNSKGEGSRARELLVIIRGLNPEKAQQLEQQLNQARDGSGN